MKTKRAPFIILALPRSRTAWLAHFLSYQGRKCGHDTAIECSSISDFASRFDNGLVGTVETGAVVGWEAIRKALPEAKIAVIKRPLEEIQASLAKLGLASDQSLKELTERRALLDQVSALPDVRTVEFAELDNPAVVCRLFEYCLGIPFDRKWWNALRNENIQVDIGGRLETLNANRSKIENLKAEAVSKADAVKVMIGPENWDTFWPEADILARSHFQEVDGGVEPNRPYNPDAAMLQRLHEVGFLKIFTARVNGVLAGYCTWNVMPDVESAGLMIAQQGAWFVRPEFARLGLGSKLFDQSITDLKAMGVHNVFPHHRLQGRGAELGTLFKRRGAVEIQHTYSLWIGA